MKNFNTRYKRYLQTQKLLSYIVSVAIILMLFSAISCCTTKTIPNQNKGIEMSNNNDSTEHTLIVLDPGYESYLTTQPSAKFYSQEYYENWNERYVDEWNYRHRNPSRFGSFYETEIYYDRREDYGLDLNYRLYYYFQFIKNEYGIVLIRRGR